MSVLSLSARIVATVAVVGAGLSACGGPQSQPSQEEPSVAVAATGTASPASNAAPTSHASQAVDLTASDVVKGLAARVRTVKMSVVYTAENDPNGELGRPGQYTSKAAFTDARINQEKVTDRTRGSTELGGGVEVFPIGAAAHARAKYIQGVLKNAPMLGAEYDYLAGGVLLRVSGHLTPTQADTLKAALQQVTDGQVQGPVQP